MIKKLNNDQMIPHTVFDELEKVKAERDMYYTKLMKMRLRME